MKKVRFARELALGMLMLILLAACAPAAAPSISIEGAWGRPSMSMPTAGAMYMVIKNSGDAPDTLLSGTSPACGSIEVHEMVMKSDGTMGMNLIDKPLEIPAGGEVTLEVGGLHIMCIMKKDTFVPDNTIDLTLVFEKSGEMPLSVELRSE
jgi:copper(I)-binding protein